MKFGQILVFCMTEVSKMLLFSMLENWKLVSCPFMILLTYSKIWPFLRTYIYHFQLSLGNLFKK